MLHEWLEQKPIFCIVQWTFKIVSTSNDIKLKIAFQTSDSDQSF